jgi:integrase/recombinase XerD
MRERVLAGMSLYGPTGERKYLNAAERRRFFKAACRAPPDVQFFCLVLGLSGGRLSEIRALTPLAIDLDSCVINIVTLKRRKRGIVRQVPLPRFLVQELNRTFRLRRSQRNPDFASRKIWRWSRTTAWRHVKEVMAAAKISGTPAMPKGLRHGFGVHAVQSKIPLPLLQRWLGHASLRTTAIYIDVVGSDERAIAARMWVGLIK